MPTSVSPQQSPSPQPWGTPGPLGSRGQLPPGASTTSPGPVGWNHSGSTVTTPQPGPGPAPPGGSPQQWPQQQPSSRSSGRPSFPSSKNDIYKGYPPSGPMLPPSGSTPTPKGSSMGGLAPINQSVPSMPPHPPQIPLGPQPSQFSQLPIPTSPVPIKKEIVFPPDSVEAITPLLGRRRKLHKVSQVGRHLWSFPLHVIPNSL